MSFYKWLADRYRKSVVDVVEEEVAGAAAADSLRYMNGIIHPSFFHLEGKNLKSNFNFVKNILGQRMINDVNEVLPSDDVWFEILRRFPAADLFPLKAVCNTFHRLISSKLFARLHIGDFIKDPKSKSSAIITSRYRDPTASRNISYYYYDPDKSTISVRYNEPRFNDLCNHVLSRIHHYRVIDSYHGLLLVKIRDRLLLCNPITRSYKFLPPIYDFDQQLSHWKLAYDAVSDQYKVFGLRIRRKREVSLYVIDVHRDKKWPYYPREKTAMDSQNIELHYGGNVLVNGSVYWLFTTVESETLNGKIRWTKRTCIISANLTTEEVKTRSCSIDSFEHNILAANGTFYQHQSSYHSYELKLWVLEGVESENPNPRWMMKHIIHTNHLTSTQIITPRYIGVVGVFCNKVLIIMRIHQCPDRLFQYDIASMEFEEVTLASGGNNIEFIVSSRIVEHIDSLIEP